jgi:protein-S-isoprenylcysteine O-methyltransferase Ste14
MARRNLLLRKRQLITRLFATVLGTVIVFSSSRWEEHYVVGHLLFLVGLALVAVATMGRVWCSLYISGYKGRCLITVGPYSLCRNPLYLFSLIGAIGLGLSTKTLTIPAVLAAAFLAYYPFVISAEEEDLRASHGSDFDAYARSTPRFFPSLARFREPDEYTIRLGALRRSVGDCMFFIWIVGLLEMVGALHEHQVIPSLWRLY